MNPIRHRQSARQETVKVQADPTSESSAAKMLNNRLMEPLLGVGAVSREAVDAAILLASQASKPVQIIASRSQVDTQALGGGYCNSWTTEQFAQYVRRHDKSQVITLARDHGGPWQRQDESNLDERAAMYRAKLSFQADIDAGFTAIHIDTSQERGKPANSAQAYSRLLELYEFCAELSKEISIEVGTEVQSSEFGSIADLKMFLNSIIAFCDKHQYQRPSFVVAQTGTCVYNAANVGRAIHIDQDENLILALSMLCETVFDYGIRLKVHNGDYMSAAALRAFVEAGAGSINVAPEFATDANRALLSILKQTCPSLYDDLIKMAVDEERWTKWCLPDSSSHQKAVVSLHYLSATSTYKAIIAKAQKQCKPGDFDVSSVLALAAKKSVARVMIAMGYNLSAVADE